MSGVQKVLKFSVEFVMFRLGIVVGYGRPEELSQGCPVEGEQFFEFIYARNNLAALNLAKVVPRLADPLSGLVLAQF